MSTSLAHWTIGISKLIRQNSITEHEDQMWYIKWIIGVIFLSLSAALLHYTLPQTDIVRITNTYEKRVDFQNTALFGPMAREMMTATL